MTRIAVIGLGRWGPNHVRNFHGLPDAEVAWAVDTDPDRRGALSELFPTIPVTSDLGRVLDDDSVDAVVIATPTATHYKLTRAALESGKHVLCEKPLCIRSEEGAELTELAHTVDRVLLVGHVFLFNPGVLKLKEIMDAGELGRIYYLAVTRTNLGPIRSDVNSVYDLASHDLSIFNHLLGSTPSVVSAVGASYVRPGVEDVAFVSLRYPDEVLANVRVSWLDPKKVRQLTVVGQGKMAMWDDLSEMGPVTLFDKGVEWQPYESFGEFKLLTRLGDVSVPHVPAEEPLKAQAKHFLAVTRGEETNRSDGRFSTDLVRVLEAISESLAQGGTPVTVAYGSDGDSTPS